MSIHSDSIERRQQGAPSPQELDTLRSLLGQVRHREAAALAQSLAERFPGFGFGWKALAWSLKGMGQHAPALAAMHRAVALSPTDAELHSEMGAALYQLGELAQAEASYRRALQIRPDYVEAYNNLGNVLQVQGRLAESKGCYRRALEFSPGAAEVHNNLGAVLAALGQVAESEGSYRRALQLTPEYPQALSNLGDVLQLQGRLAESESSYRRALQLNPQAEDVHNNLGCVLLAQARVAESEASFLRALQIRPAHDGAHSNLLLSLNYQAGRTGQEILRAHREYDARFGAPHRETWLHRRNLVAEPADDRRLRVGYVSPDFRQHSVAAFIRPLLREHDRRGVDVFCYANVARPDAVTADLEGLADHWVDTQHLPHAALAERIAADRIDILVDLAGHTSGNRLLVFARKPAPIQITWLGYPNTTGLGAMDYRLVDALTDPPGEADRWASETLIRLENGFLCFEPPAQAPLPRAPARPADGVIFGSFNNPAKLSQQTLAAWAVLLARVGGSRLLLKGRGFADEAIRQDFLARFARHGGDPQRVDLQGFVGGPADHLAWYERMDIALDPFPYNGTTTTCEALWMGVPVVTLLGTCHAARVGASLLTRIGLSEFVARTVEDYIRIAATLAAHQEHRGLLRQTLRERMRTSPLCDARAFARSIEATYRELWQRHRGACSGATLC